MTDHIDLDGIQSGIRDARRRNTMVVLEPDVLGALIDRLRKAEAAVRLVKAHLSEPECAIWRHVHQRLDAVLAAPDGAPTDSAEVDHG